MSDISVEEIGKCTEQPLYDSAFPTRPLLCLMLYQRLRKVQGHGGVLIANEGEHMTGTLAPPDAAGRQRWIVSTWGESYRVNCPFCRDTRHRLWINYRFGQPDPVNLHQMGTFYGICFNEDCLANPENRAELVDVIYGVHNPAERTQFLVSTEGNVNKTQRLCQRPFPGTCRPLTEMTVDEPAVQYLTGERNFGFETAEEFQLRYCMHSDEFPAAGGRIIAPIIQHGTMFGWQGRWVGEPPNKFTPKYYTCPGLPRRLLLYNIDRAAGKPFVVVMEGITDVWRLPDYGVGLLGKTMSLEQLALLQLSFPHQQPIVLCLDPETHDNCAMKIHELVNIGCNPVARVRLPDNCDPADLDSDVLLNTILTQAAAAGVTLQI